jgi:receptor protein-tyrosine kinase
MYTTTTQFFVSTRNAQSTSDIYQGSQFSQQRVTSYAQLVTGQQVAARVIERLELSETASDLSRRISADPLPDTVLINVSVTDESPERAQGIAQALGEDFPEFAAELESSEGGVASPVTVRVTETARLPRSPSSPKPLRNSGLGLLVGALAGAGLAVLRARLDQTLKDPDETGRLAGAPVIGTVLRDEALDKQHTIDRVPSTRTAEDYRQLRNNLQFLNVDEPPKVIMVTSALPSEGKTTAVVNLGLTLAYAGQRVTIVEADLRKPKVARYLRMVGGVGLTNILAGSADVDDVVQRHGNGDLSVIASGPTPPNPGELLSSSHMAALLEKLRGANDFVLIDAPPLLPVADSSGLAPYVDGVLISVRYGSTRKEQLQQAAATLERVGATTLGVILNIVPPKAELATAYGYGYGYQAGGPKHA